MPVLVQRAESHREPERHWGGEEPTKRRTAQKEKAASGSGFTSHRGPYLAAAVLGPLGGLRVHSTSYFLEARPPGVRGRVGSGRLAWDREMEGLEDWEGVAESS